MLYVYGFIALLIAGLGATSYIYYLKYENVAQQYEIVLEVNKNNMHAMKELRESWAADRAITKKELAAAQKRATAIENIQKEIENAPDAQKPVGPFFDELSRRLQSTNNRPEN